MTNLITPTNYKTLRRRYGNVSGIEMIVNAIEEMIADKDALAELPIGKRLIVARAAIQMACVAQLESEVIQ